MENQLLTTDIEEDYEKLLTTILESRTIIRDTIKEDILKDLNTEKEIEQECLKIEDIEYDIYSLEKRFDEVYQKHIKIDELSNLRKSLASCYLDSQFDSIIGKFSSIGNMVENSFRYDQKMALPIAEQICYLNKITENWRTINGDGNCFYRSAMFNFLENLIFEKDIMMFKKIITDIELKFSEDYINTKFLEKNIKNSITKMNKRLVIYVLYLIYDLLDSINTKIPGDDLVKIKEAYSYLIKAMNNSKTFDTVYNI